MGGGRYTVAVDVSCIISSQSKGGRHSISADDAWKVHQDIGGKRYTLAVGEKKAIKMSEVGITAKLLVFMINYLLHRSQKSLHTNLSYGMGISAHCGSVQIRPNVTVHKKTRYTSIFVEN